MNICRCSLKVEGLGLEDRFPMRKDLLANILLLFFILPLLGIGTKCQTTSENKKSKKCFKKVKKATTVHGSSVQSIIFKRCLRCVTLYAGEFCFFLSFMHTNLAFPSTKANAGIGYTNIYKALLGKTGELNIDDIF